MRTVESPMPLYTGFIQLGAGLSVGLAGLAAGFAIGIVGDAGVRGTAQQPRLFVGMVSWLDWTVERCLGKQAVQWRLGRVRRRGFPEGGRQGSIGRKEGRSGLD